MNPRPLLPAATRNAAKPKAWLRATLGTALLTLAGCSDSAAPSAVPGPSAAAAAPAAGYVVVHPHPVTISSSIAGRVVALQTAEIRPQVGGLIQERVFQEGSQVQQGDVLFRIDPDSYQAAVDAADATLQKADAVATAAKAKAERYANLSGSLVVSQQDREDAQSTYLQAVADVAVARADLRTARINLDHTTITAPISGQIGTSSVNSGSLVTASQTDALATIRQLDPVYVDLTETSGNLLRFRNQVRSGELTRLVGPGTRPEVRLRFTDGTPYAEVGTIDAAEQFVSQTTSSFVIRARFDNPERLLLPGTYMQASVTLASDEKAFLLPQRAVSRNARGEATARFIKPDGTAETRTLAISTDIGTNWLVTEGVGDGDKLIVDGLQRVKDGQPVEGTEVSLDANGLIQTASADAAGADTRKAH